MPDALINRTPAGWPYLDEDNYLDVIDNYTLELATKLQNGEADVAAAINAAEQALALVQVTGPAAVGDGIALGTGWSEVGGAYSVQVKRVGKVVHCTGLVNPGASPGGTVLVLPAWARPRRVGRSLCVSANKATGLIGLEVDGTLSYQAGWWTSAPGGGWVSLPTSWEAA